MSFKESESDSEPTENWEEVEEFLVRDSLWLFLCERFFLREEPCPLLLLGLSVVMQEKSYITKSKDKYQ